MGGGEGEVEEEWKRAVDIGPEGSTFVTHIFLAHFDGGQDPEILPGHVPQCIDVQLHILLLLTV